MNKEHHVRAQYQKSEVHIGTDKSYVNYKHSIFSVDIISFTPIYDGEDHWGDDDHHHYTNCDVIVIVSIFFVNIIVVIIV